MSDDAKREELSDEDDFSDAALVRWLRTKYSRHGELEDKMAADRLEKLLAAAIAGPFAWAKFEGDGSISLLTDEPFVDATPLYALAAPVSAQTPAGEALREAIEWAETVLCALQPTEQVRMRVLIAAALASQSSARPQEGADTAEDFCGVPHDYSHRETRAGTAYRIAAWTCPTCAKRCSCMVLDGEHCHGDSLCIRFVDGVRTVHCGACWIADSPSPAAKVADALAELVACLAEQAAIPYGRTPDEAERAFNRRRANERRTERALTGGREALAAYLARPSCTYPACRCEGPGPDGGCGSAAIPSPDGAAG